MKAYTPLKDYGEIKPEITDLKSSEGSGYFIMKKNGIPIYVYCFDPEDEKLKLLSTLPMSPYLDGEYKSLVINGGLYGNFLVTRKYDGEKSLVVYDLSDVENPSIHEYHSEKNNRISCMCVSEKFVVAGNWDGEINIWTLKTGKPKTDEVKTEKPKKDNYRIIKIPNTLVHAVGVSLNEECLFVGLNHKSTDTFSLDIMDFNGKRLHRLEHEDKIHSIIECPKHKRLIIGCSKGYIYIWDLSNMKCLFRSRGGKGSCLKNLHYDPDTSRIFGRFYGGIVMIWNFITGTCLQIIQAYEEDYLSNCPMCILENGNLVMGMNNRLVLFEKKVTYDIDPEIGSYNLRKINDNLKDDDIKINNIYHEKSGKYYRDILMNDYHVQVKAYDWYNFFDDYPDAINTDFLTENLEKLDNLAWSHISYNLDPNKVDLEKFQKYLNWKDISAFRQLSKEIIIKNKDWVYWPFIEKSQKRISEEFVQKHKPKIENK